MQQQARILIVDDSPTNVMLLEEILGKEFQLKTSSCGEEAMAIAPVFCPAVILLDIVLPGIDGYETGTPLNHILLSLDLLGLEGDMAPEIRNDLIGTAKDGALRLQHLFQQVWKLSQLKAGTYPIQLIPADLCLVVRDASSEVAIRARKRNVHLEQRLPQAAFSLLSFMQMQEVVVALLDNAIRFSPSGERVVIEVVRNDGDLCLTVTDHGDGIAPDFLPFVFEAFANQGITRRAAGPGLSLAIAQQIVQIHNGAIGVDSTPGKQTRFSLQLPSLNAGAVCAWRTADATGSRPYLPRSRTSRSSLAVGAKEGKDNGHHSTSPSRI